MNINSKLMSQKKICRTSNHSQLRLWLLMCSANIHHPDLGLQGSKVMATKFYPKFGFRNQTLIWDVPFMKYSNSIHDKLHAWYTGTLQAICY